MENVACAHPLVENRRRSSPDGDGALRSHLCTPLDLLRRQASLDGFARSLLESAGIAVNGRRAGDMVVHHPRLFRRLLGGGSLALGESYMDGWWECRALDEFSRLVHESRLKERVRALSFFAARAGSRLVNRQSRRRSRRVARRHYDAGNGLYAQMLDERMTYTCGYWKEASCLDEAQEAKLELVCRKIGLKEGMTLLDIGCGWGSFLRYAARRHGARVMGVTISREQAALARERCRGLPAEVRLEDYRDVRGTFDRVVSLGMFEHVGHRNHGTFMDVVRRRLAPDGLFLLQTIGADESETTLDPWFERYIFPGGLIPSVAQIARAAEGRFVMEDWHNFGPDYDRTLMAWHANFQRHWPAISAGEGLDEPFRRMWSYYLLCSAGAFRARRLQLWQILFSPENSPPRAAARVR